MRTGRSMAGVSLVELVSVTAIVLVLAAVTIPVGQTMYQRQKEIELRQALRTMREAIDRFQQDVDTFPGIRQNVLNTVNEDGYPEELEWLYEGVDIGDAAGTRIKYLRRLPIDPMTGKREWGTRSSRDQPGSLFSDGVNIFDVYSLSEATSLDGETKYAEW